MVIVGVERGNQIVRFLLSPPPPQPPPPPPTITNTPLSCMTCHLSSGSWNQNQTQQSYYLHLVIDMLEDEGLISTSTSTSTSTTGTINKSKRENKNKTSSTRGGILPLQLFSSSSCLAGAGCAYSPFSI